MGTILKYARTLAVGTGRKGEEAFMTKEGNHRV